MVLLVVVTIVSVMLLVAYSTLKRRQRIQLEKCTLDIQFRKDTRYSYRLEKKVFFLLLIYSV